MPLTAADVCRSALREVGVLAPDEAGAAPDLAYALEQLNRLIDLWNAERAAVYNVTFATYTLTPSLAAHTIGPSGATFTVPQRPEAITGANIVLTDVTPVVRAPLSLRDDAWWLAQPVRDLTAQLPTDLYYSPDWPNGSIYLWPIPTIAWELELELRLVLTGALVLTDVISLPPGYWDALVLSTAERLLRQYPRQANGPGVVEAAAKARARVWAANDVTPRMATRDLGMEPGNPSRGSFNYLTRQFSR